MNQSLLGTTAILTVAQPTGATVQTGVAKILRPSAGDDVNLSGQAFRFGASAQFNGGATTPTGQVKIQGSFDNVSWFTIAAGSVCTSDDSILEEFLAETANQVVPKYVRAVTALAGGTAPTKQVVTVWVTSNAEFTVTDA